MTIIKDCFTCNVNIYYMTCASNPKNENRPKKCFVIVLNLNFWKVSEGKTLIEFRGKKKGKKRKNENIDHGIQVIGSNHVNANNIMNDAWVQSKAKRFCFARQI